MDGMGWRARIDAAGDSGAGILVSATRLLTCAHVVGGLSEEVHVTFPSTAGRLPARVAWRGPWTRQGDHGDLAVVELDSPAPADPCDFAGLDALRPRPGQASYELHALGFPRGHEDNGIHVTLRTSDDRMLAREWLQADVDQAHLQNLSEGFSGAAVWIPGSNLVAGMITDAVLNEDGNGFIGRMLPLSTIRRYWDGLDDLLPLQWLAPDPRQELRAAVDGMTPTADLGSIFRKAFPAFLRPPPDFRSVWDAIRYVGESLQGEDRLQRYLVALSAHLGGEARLRLAGWIRRWFPAAAGLFEQTGAPAASIVIVLSTPTRDGAKHIAMTVREVRGGTWATLQPAAKVRRDQIQPQVEKAITRQVSNFHGTDWMIEIAAPQREMGHPFESWLFLEPGASRPRPMRSVPLVVWDSAWLNPRNFAADRARQRWRTLRSRGKTSFEPVGCRLGYSFDDFRGWLDGDDELCALVYGSHPRNHWLEAALDAGIPIMLWCRQLCACGHDSHDSHAEFIRQVTAALSASEPDRLPVEVMKLRKKAWSPAGGGEQHCGRNLTLYWQDPARLPDPPLEIGST